MLPADLLDLLCCPVTRLPLGLADGPVLQKLNARLRDPAVGLRNAAGEKITEALEAALLRADGAVVYPVRDGIPVLLAAEAIVVG